MKFSKPKRKQPPSLTSFYQAFGRREANNKVVGACILLHFLGVHCNRVARMRAQNLQFSTTERFPNEFHFSKLWSFKLLQIIPYLFDMNKTYRAEVESLLSCVFDLIINVVSCLSWSRIDFTQIVFLMD